MDTEMPAPPAAILFPGYERLLKIGWKGVYAELMSLYNALEIKNATAQKEPSSKP